jgi:hypothetical protein
VVSDELGSSRPNTPDSAFDSSLPELVGAEEPAGAAVASTAGATTPEGPVLETDVGAVTNGVRANSNGATAPAAAGGIDSIVVAGLLAANELTGPIPVVDDVGAECFGAAVRTLNVESADPAGLPDPATDDVPDGAAPPEAGGVELDAESECVPAGLVGGVRCLVGPTISARVVVDPDAVVVLVLADGVLPPVSVVAWAMPDPLASAAPTPRVRAPAPSQVDAWLRRCWAAR